MLMHQRFVPGLAIASYIVGDQRSGDAVVIDPTRDVEDFVQFACDNDLLYPISSVVCLPGSPLIYPQ
jgi:hydroxyacylglutathione hydrolase